MDARQHWDRVYGNKSPAEVSWYQSNPEPSLGLIAAATAGERRRVIDVGGGASVLADRLLDAGHEVAVLDVSASALAHAKVRLGERATRVRWIEADVTNAPDLGSFDVWHDRAVFHFLTEAADRRRYAQVARKTVVVGGHLVAGTFAPDGPTRCSGLEVRRWDADALAAEFSGGFRLVRACRDAHLTPDGRQQTFTYVLLCRGNEGKRTSEA